MNPSIARQVRPHSAEPNSVIDAHQVRFSSLAHRYRTPSSRTTLDAFSSDEFSSLLVEEMTRNINRLSNDDQLDIASAAEPFISPVLRRRRLAWANPSRDVELGNDASHNLASGEAELASWRHMRYRPTYHSEQFGHMVGPFDNVDEDMSVNRPVRPNGAMEQVQGWGQNQSSEITRRFLRSFATSFSIVGEDREVYGEMGSMSDWTTVPGVASEGDGVRCVGDMTVNDLAVRDPYGAYVHWEDIEVIARAERARYVGHLGKYRSLATADGMNNEPVR